MEPVRIKLYGVLSMTRSRYLTQMGIGLGFAFVLLLVWWFQWTRFRQELVGLSSPGFDRLIVFWDILPWIIACVMGLQGLEALIVLRLFRRKEAERATAQPVSSHEQERSTHGP